MHQANPNRYIKLRALVGAIVALNAFAAHGNPHANASGIAHGQYEIESQMVMPHLDEMRHVSKTRRACFGGDVRDFFPVMRQPALGTCGLSTGAREEQAKNYVLRCNGSDGASGRIEITAAGATVKGSLQAKMGGKNMTFVQFISARRVGACSDEK